MTSEISKVGEDHLREWTEQQREIRDELNSELLQHRAEHDTWQAKVDSELQKLRSEKEEHDQTEAELEQKLRRAQDEMAQQHKDLRIEAAEKARELQEIELRIQDLHSETRELEDSRPGREERAADAAKQAAIDKKNYDDLQAEVAELKQDIVKIRSNRDELKEEIRKYERAGEPQTNLQATIQHHEAKVQELNSEIAEQREKQEDLQRQLDSSGNRGLFRCFRPRASGQKPRGETPAPLSSGTFKPS